jgi:transposase InsO family protein
MADMIDKSNAKAHRRLLTGQWEGVSIAPSDAAFETGSEARTGIGRWVGYYNADRPHSAFGGRTPDEVYATQAGEEKLAA